MKSWVAMTEEIDELEEAIEQLKAQIPFEELKKNTVGIIFAYYDIDYERLAELVKDEFAFPIVGIGTMAALGNDGYFDYGMELLVMSADDVQFQVGMTGHIDLDTYKEKVTDLYQSLKIEEPKLIITYASKLMNGVGDDYVEHLTQISGGALVYGAHPSDMFTYKDFWLFYDGKAENYAATIIALSGNIKPVTTVEFSVSNQKAIEGKVTKATENAVFTIGNQKFTEVLEQNGLASENENVIREFSQTPFVAEIQVEEDESVEVLRNLMYLKHDVGSGMFLGKVPENSSLRIANLKVNDIGISVGKAFETLFKKLEEDSEYTYSTIICTSCMARYMNLVGDKNIEGKAYEGLLPKEMQLVGMYAYGEMCPKKSNHSDKFYNMFYNQTFTILAF